MILKSLTRGAVTAALLVGAALAAPGCGGSDDDKSQIEYCEDTVEILCRKIFNCFEQDILDAYKSVFGLSQSDCRTKYESSLCNEDRAKCPSGKQFNPSRQKECNEGYDDFSCDDVEGYLIAGTVPDPAACELICQQE